MERPSKPDLNSNQNGFCFLISITCLFHRNPRQSAEKLTLYNEQNGFSNSFLSFEYLSPLCMMIKILRFVTPNPNSFFLDLSKIGPIFYKQREDLRQSFELTIYIFLQIIYKIKFLLGFDVMNTWNCICID